MEEITLRDLVLLQANGITGEVLVDNENSKCFTIKLVNNKEVIICYKENEDLPCTYDLAKDAWFGEYVLGASSQNFSRAF